jgi:hypothetical protein
LETIAELRESPHPFTLSILRMDWVNRLEILIATILELGEIDLERKLPD